MIRTFFLFVAFLIATPALAQDYPALSGRVVDTADLLDPGQEAQLTAKLEALERASSRQLVVLTLPDLGGRTIENYGVGLGNAWGIGQRDSSNGVVLIIAVSERKMRIEVGRGLEGIMTDALSSRIIREQITPRFRERDFAGGINAGVDAIIEQLQAPPEMAEQRALAAAQAEQGRDNGGGSSFLPLIFWLAVFVFILIPTLITRLRGRKYRGRRGRTGPVVIWGPGLGGSGHSSGGSSWSSGSSWGSGGSSWSGGGGGFSGGGGSFGGGGASGGW